MTENENARKSVRCDGGVRRNGNENGSGNVKDGSGIVSEKLGRPENAKCKNGHALGQGHGRGALTERGEF